MPDMLRLLLLARNVEKAFHNIKPASEGGETLRLSTSVRVDTRTVNLTVQVAANVSDIPSTLPNAVTAAEVEQGHPTLTDIGAIILSAYESHQATYEFASRVNKNLLIMTRVDAELIG